MRKAYRDRMPKPSPKASDASEVSFRKKRYSLKAVVETFLGAAAQCHHSLYQQFVYF